MKKWIIAVSAAVLSIMLVAFSSCASKKTEAPPSLTPSASQTESAESMSSTPLEPSAPKTIVVKQISCSHELISLVEGETLALTFSVLPEDAENKELTFSIEPKEVASYENGVVTALKAGTAVMRVASADEGDAVLEIPVEVAAYIPVTEVLLDRSQLTFAVEESCSISCTVLPENATEPQITWKVEDTSVVRLENGTLTALKAGSTVLTVQSTSSRIVASLQITVLPHENHRMGEWEVVFPASCTEVGMRIRYCVVCHTEYYEYEAIEMLEHEYGAVVTVREATRLENGVGEKTCASCKGIEEVVLRVSEQELVYGQLGDEIEYSFYSDGELYIRGEGQMYQWDSQKVSPIRSLSGVKKVFFSGNIELITDTTFEGLTELEQVVFNDGLKMIGNRAFYGCIALTGIDLPETLQFVGGGAFAGCKKITQAAFSSALLGLGQSAFEDCTSLMTIAIGKNIASIGSRAFAGCTALQKAAFDGSKAYFDTHVLVESGNEILSGKWVFNS